MLFYPENEYSRFPRNIDAYLPEQTESRLHIMPLISKPLPDPRMEFSLQVTYSFPLGTKFKFFFRTMTCIGNRVQHATDSRRGLNMSVMVSLLAVYQVYTVIRRRMTQDELSRMWKDGCWNIWTIPAFPLRKRKERDLSQARSEGSRKFIFVFWSCEAWRFLT